MHGLSIFTLQLTSCGPERENKGKWQVCAIVCVYASGAIITANNADYPFQIPVTVFQIKVDKQIRHVYGLKKGRKIIMYYKYYIVPNELVQDLLVKALNKVFTLRFYCSEPLSYKENM